MLNFASGCLSSLVFAFPLLQPLSVHADDFAVRHAGYGSPVVYGGHHGYVQPFYGHPHVSHGGYAYPDFGHSGYGYGTRIQTNSFGMYRQPSYFAPRVSRVSSAPAYVPPVIYAPAYDPVGTAGQTSSGTRRPIIHGHYDQFHGNLPAGHPWHR